MIKKSLQTTALLILSMACIWCGGCGRRNGPEMLQLQESRSDTETEDVVQDNPRLSETLGSTEKTEDSRRNENNISEEHGMEQEGEESTQQIFVYVCGAVNSPGVYELKAGSRLYEAIACAGGVREDAAEESINQAQAVSDGERLYIPTDEEVRQGIDAYLQSSLTGVNGSVEAAGADLISAAGKSGVSANGKVNINTASREELKTLNGIGDTRAGNILAYRESNGPFGSIEDLMKVEGIKEGVYNKLKDDITVN